MAPMVAEDAKLMVDRLKDAIVQIFARNSSNLKFEEIYKISYNLVLNKHGDMLYEEVTGLVARFLEGTVNMIEDVHGKDFINFIVTAWSDHILSCRMVADISMYTERAYVAITKKLPIYNHGMKSFKDKVLFSPDVRQRLRLALLEDIEIERMGCMIDSNALKTALAMYVDLAIYKDEFEVFFLAETKNFYAVESLAFISSNTCSDYLIKMETRFAEEEARINSYIPGTTEAQLMAVMKLEWLANHTTTMIEMESGLLSMLQDDKYDDLRRLYQALSKVPQALDMLRDGVARFLTEKGIEIVNNEESQKDPIGFVKNVLDLKDKFDKIIRDSFGGDKDCEKKVRDGFVVFVNKDTRCACFLASYVDELLRSGVSGTSEDEVEAKLNKVIVIFKHILDKDVFENYYRTQLCKRLLAGKSGSDEIEQLMIAKLKTECGYQFTNKLEGMLVDIANSRSVMDMYRKTDFYTKAAIEVDIQVLTTGYWPLTATKDLCLPPVVSHYCDAFTAFYLDKHSGRKLSWVMHTGTADIKAMFPEGRRDLNVSNYQMCILMLFNHADTLSLEAIRAATNIPDIELRRHLLSLCTPKIKILVKASKGKGIENDDSFTFNHEFTSKFKRIKIPLISAKEVQPIAGDDALPTAVVEERTHLTEAAIVRTMKARKTMNHNDLIAEVLRQLSIRFTPTPPFIKKRIESLIEREYLQRNLNDARCYDYLA